MYIFNLCYRSVNICVLYIYYQFVTSHCVSKHQTSLRAISYAYQRPKKFIDTPKYRSFNLLYIRVSQTAEFWNLNRRISYSPRTLANEPKPSKLARAVIYQRE